MFEKPTYEELEQKVKELERENDMLKEAASSWRNTDNVYTTENTSSAVGTKTQYAEEQGIDGIIGCNVKMKEIFKTIKDFADVKLPVLIQGENGTGKELVARSIHGESKYANEPFVVVNYGLLSQELLEDKFIEYVKGSFVEAIRAKKEPAEMAHRGTLFLNEVTNIPQTIHLKLLQILEAGKIEWIDNEKLITVDTRIICATNKDLKQEVKKGCFNDNLYYSMNVIQIDIPPLRKRKTDIPLLVEHFLKQAAGPNSKTVYKISKPAVLKMINYNWPGNVNELENVIRFSIVKCKGDIIMPDDLPGELSDRTKDLSKNSTQKRGPSGKLDIDAVNKALIQTRGNKAKTARVLGVGRATLYRFLNNHPEVAPYE